MILIFDFAGCRYSLPRVVSGHRIHPDLEKRAGFGGLCLRDNLFMDCSVVGLIFLSCYIN